MSLIYLATLVSLSCWISTTQSLICEPNTRYPHPLNCSLFILCDKFSKAITLPCPNILHFNANMSYCDWPENAKCNRELKEATNATDAGKENENNFLNAMQTIIENMHNTDEKENNSNNLKDTGNTTGHSEDKITELKGTEQKYSRKKIAVHIITESNDKNAEEQPKSHGIENEKEAINGTGDSSTHESEITAYNGTLENNKTDAAPNLHNISRRQVEHIKDITKEQETSKKGENDKGSKFEEVKILKISKTYNHTSGYDLSFNKTQDKNVTLVVDDFIVGMNETGPGLDRNEYPELADNNSSIYYPYFDVHFNLTLNNPNDNLGYEEIFSDIKNVTTERALNSTLKKSDTESAS